MNVALIERWIRDNGPHGAEKLAVEAGVSIHTVRNVRDGHVPNVDTAKKFAQALGVSLDDLCRDHGPPKDAA